VDSVRGLGLHAHVCWSYDDKAEFQRRAREFLAEGLALGQRVCHVNDHCRPDAVLEPEAQVAEYAAATEQALADGFAGLRVAVDVTALVWQPAQIDAVARYEHLIEQYMVTHPFAALCGYNRAELGEQTVAQLACMHPNTTRDATPFRLYGSTDAGCSAELAGELDLLSAELFPTALRRANPRPHRGRVVLDAAKVGFMDHRSLIALDDHARDRGIPVLLRTDLSTPARVIDALDLTGVRVDLAAGSARSRRVA
jgi:hypothetical protein